MSFSLTSPYAPAGGQPEAIKSIIKGFEAKNTKQTLLGITGSGKTFVMANVIQKIGKPTLVLAHNKTLAAQLYQELKALFPNNRVEYFVSYYDYYQPESYMPASDVYIEKESTVNAEIEKMRLRATASLLARDDVIVVSSISCIYGLGSPDDFFEMSLEVEKGKECSREEILKHLVEMQYERKDPLEPGGFRVRGDTIDVYPSYDDKVIRIELFGKNIDTLQELEPVSNLVQATITKTRIFPAKQYVVPEEKQKRAIENIKEELEEWAPELADLERHRLEKRVKYDLEMIEELGFCSGIENYSRHFEGREKGSAPSVLLDFFPQDFLLIIDESHQSIPQSRAMFRGDLARKKNLVDFGFRLPCAYDNRPLKFEEFEKYFRKVLFVSATPGEYEKEHSDAIVELIIRPTGLVDPLVEVRSSQGQIPDILKEIDERVKKDERVLITTLTKRMAEDLCAYLAQKEVKVRYLHSEIDNLDRIELIRELRAKEFDVLVGINLLREGLDLPEVSLVCVLDANKEGFLRNETSLIQTIGRAARNANGKVILYADEVTDSMQRAIDITKKRREAQIAYNKKHNITPQTIIKAVAKKGREIKGAKHLAPVERQKKMIELEYEMKKAAEELDFERAIALRDALHSLEQEDTLIEEKKKMKMQREKRKLRQRA